MSPQPRFTVRTDKKVVGDVLKNRTHWTFRPAAGISLAESIQSSTTLKRLAEIIRETLGVKEVYFQDAPLLVKDTEHNKSKPRKRRQKLKLTEKEWQSLEREQSKHSPRPVSMESRGGTTGRGRPLSGGLPGLGKRR